MNKPTFSEKRKKGSGLIRADNAVIMAAGTSSRFAPLSYEKPKALYEVRGEILIERQIRQLREAGINDIIVVVGYRKEQFAYLADRFGVEIIENPEYGVRNNNSTIWAVRNRLGNSYICSSDNYFVVNPFEREVSGPYYAACYSKGETEEWCIGEGQDGYINSVSVGGRDSWFMIGHAFWDSDFSEKYVRILESVYSHPETAPLLWESIYAKNLDVLKLGIRKYGEGAIREFDTLEDLRKFDESYIDDTRSEILKNVAAQLNCSQGQICDIVPVKSGSGTEATGFLFSVCGRRFQYSYSTRSFLPSETT